MTNHISDKQIKQIIRLQTDRSFREEQQQFVVEGQRALQQVLATSMGKQLLEYMVTLENDFSSQFVQKIITASKTVFRKISNQDTPSHVLGVFRIPLILNWERQSKKQNEREYDNDIVLMLDQIQDPSNLGGIIRTAAWFGVKQIVSTKGTCDFFNPKTVRAAAGSIFALPLIASPTDGLETVEHYESMGYNAFVTTLKAGKLGLNQFLNCQKILLILGNEGGGVSKKILDSISKEKHITIAGNRTAVESLNVVASVTTLLALYCHRNKLLKLS